LNDRRHRRPLALSWGWPTLWRCMQLSSTLLGVECGTKRARRARAVPQPPFPCAERHRFIPICANSPSEFRFHLSTARPAGRASPPEVCATSNGIHARAPSWSGLSQAHPGSALRLSQPLSGFPASASSTALFHAAAVCDRLLRSLPLTEDRVRLPTPLAPMRLSTNVGDEPRTALSPPVSPTPTLLTR